jgi:hypothetical protein
MCCVAIQSHSAIEIPGSVARQSLFWHVASWNFTEVQRDKLVVLQRATRGKMIDLKRSRDSLSDDGDEKVERHMRRLNSTISNLFHKHTIVRWDQHYLSLLATFAVGSCGSHGVI